MVRQRRSDLGSAPSTDSSIPVMKLEPSDARNRAVLAISSLRLTNALAWPLVEPFIDAADSVTVKTLIEIARDVPDVRRRKQISGLSIRMIRWQGLSVVNIDRRTCEAPTRHSAHKRLLIHQRAARCIDQSR